LQLFILHLITNSYKIGYSFIMAAIISVSMVPAIERTYGVFWNYWMSPRRVTYIYARTVSNIAYNTAATRRLVFTLTTNAIFTNYFTEIGIIHQITYI
jgi:hypothetical protein